MKRFGRIPVAATALLWACGNSGGGGAPGPGTGADGGDASPGAGDAGATDSSAASGGDAGADAGGSTAGPDAGCGGPMAGKLQHPNPIVSRAGTAFSSPAGGSAVIDGVYHNGGWSAGTPTVATPSWVAIKLAAGPTRVLVSWDDGGTYDYDTYLEVPAAGSVRMVYGFPADYHIDTSADSTNGSDGTWTTQATVTGNSVRTRAHSIDFTGKSWVKMVITAAPTTVTTPSGAANPVLEPNGVQIGEIDVHDLSAAGSCLPDDTWFFMGDSITAFAYDRAQIHQPSFAAGIHTASTTYFPAMINGGVGSELSRDGLARLPEALSLNPDYRFFVLSYGTNDAANDQAPPQQYQTNMQSMIDMVKQAGRIPVIPHIPFSGDGSHGGIPAYDTVIDTLTQQNQLPVGPDLYTYFMQNQALFVCPPCGGRTTDNLHPDDTGLAGMNALWTQTMRLLYP